MEAKHRACGIAGNTDSPTTGKAFRQFLKIVATNRVEKDVYPPPVGYLLNPLEDILFGVINHVICPQGLDELGLLQTTSSGYDMGTCIAGNLYPPAGYGAAG